MDTVSELPASDNKTQTTEKPKKSLPEPLQLKSPKHAYKGNIDLLQSGELQGWCLDELDEKKSLNFSVYANDKLVGSGIANNNRPDLLSHFESAHHGFSIQLDSSIKQCIGQNLQLKINNTDLMANGLTIGLPDGMFYLGVRDCNDGVLKGTLISESFEGEKKLLLYSDGKLIHHMSLNIQPGNTDFSYPLPLSLNDDMIHELRLGIEGFPFMLWQGYEKVNMIKTPWQYLKKGFQEKGLISLSPLTQYRYESLGKQLTYALDTQAVKNIQLAHEAVVTGFDNRKTFPQLTVPDTKHPKVSIIIPVYNQFALTYHCVASIILAANHASYEIIIGDDCSTDETQNIMQTIKGIKVAKTTENQRFLGNCNNAAKLAKGEYIIFLNNDTEVTSSWIDELLSPFTEDESIGITGSKLLNLDGSLQEAGGIVWGNGKPWNVGNGQNPLAPEFNYSRDVDYVSGAALCIPRKLWDKVGHFSEEFKPAYYEDTDLCFKVRDFGYRVRYIPQSVVVHFEGKSNGTDLSSGVKKYQVVNSATFEKKWINIYYGQGEASFENLKIEKDRNVNQRILMIDYTTPDQTADAGSFAAISEMKILQALGHKVTFVPENMAHMGKLSYQLQKMGVEALYAPFYTSVFDVIEQRIHEFDAVYITRFSVAENYIDFIRARTDAKILFNNADLHFLRELRAAMTTGEVTIDQAKQTKSREVAVMEKVDAILSYNELEHAIIATHTMRSDNIFRCPWLLGQKPKTAPFAKRNGIAFLGSFRHHPNSEAVKHFVATIFPLILKDAPDTLFTIYGSNPTDEILALENDNIVVKGFVEELDDVYQQHKVFVAPLISGAGIKGKVLEAMAFGTPSVLTPIAAEATGLIDGLSAAISDDDEVMAKDTLKLLNDKTLWEKYSQASRKIAKDRFSLDTGKGLMQKAFDY
ncbi:MAG: glycosyltransferase, partial [Cellvibrionales bacterium]|nr:glycosyltransferase [Cellvibrionales bacterium]